LSPDVAQNLHEATTVCPSRSKTLSKIGNFKAGSDSSCWVALTELRDIGASQSRLAARLQLKGEEEKKG